MLKKAYHVYTLRCAYDVNNGGIRHMQPVGRRLDRL